MIPTESRDNQSITHTQINDNDEIVWKKGYKGFTHKLTSFKNDFQFEINKIYFHHDQPIELCNHGFHFCRNLCDVMEYYDITCNERHRYCEIEYDSREGKVIHGKGYNGGKSVTSSIKIVRELTEKEIRELLKRKYEVWRDEETKKLHRENDLPAYILYHENGSKQYEEWYNNGKLHRDNDLPAIICYYENKTKKREQWYINGVRSRDRDNDLPVLIFYHENGKKKYEQWFNNGKEHRDNDLPALIFYHENGKKKLEYWCINGKEHRENDLPAVIRYYNTDVNRIVENNGVIGSVKREEWYVNGERHREEDRPAFIHYYKNGSVSREEWFTHDKYNRKGNRPTSISYSNNDVMEMKVLD